MSRKNKIKSKGKKSRVISIKKAVARPIKFNRVNALLEMIQENQHLSMPIDADYATDAMREKTIKQQQENSIDDLPLFIGNKNTNTDISSDSDNKNEIRLDELLNQAANLHEMTSGYFIENDPNLISSQRLIEIVGDFLRLANSIRSYPKYLSAKLAEAAACKQDIEHNIEFVEETPDQAARNSRKLKAVLTARRDYKDLIAIAKPLANYFGKYDSFLAKLQPIYTNMTKYESNKSSREYIPRSAMDLELNNHFQSLDDDKKEVIKKVYKQRLVNNKRCVVGPVVPTSV